MKKAILSVSFGTTYEDTREKTIDRVEEKLKAGFPEWKLLSAYTSGMIRQVLEKRGRKVLSPQEALETLQKAGTEEILVQPTHLICGEEFERLEAAVGEYRGCFSSLKLGLPLLAGEEDIQEAARKIAARFPQEEGTALVLMGHGTSHPVDKIYSRVQEVFREQGREDIFVGCVEGGLGMPSLSPKQWKKVMLTPLMLVAGDHAKNDMAGEEPDSWQSLFREQGFQVETVLKGLGEYPEIQEMYLRHARQAKEV